MITPLNNTKRMDNQNSGIYNKEGEEIPEEIPKEGEEIPEEIQPYTGGDVKISPNTLTWNTKQLITQENRPKLDLYGRRLLAIKKRRINR